MADTGAPYFIPYAEPTDLVRDWPELSEDVALAIVAALENIPVLEKRVVRFTGSGTWTVPSGVTYAIAHMLGGGGGGASRLTPINGTNGGNSSVAFASGTVVAEGGQRAEIITNDGTANTLMNVPANSGRGGGSNRGGDGNSGSGSYTGSVGLNGAEIVAGAAVTPAASISVVVGAGGNASTSSIAGADGGSGYVWIEYYEEV